jgi:hypothetical protein
MSTGLSAAFLCRRATRPDYLASGAVEFVARRCETLGSCLANFRRGAPNKRDLSFELGHVLLDGEVEPSTGASRRAACVRFDSDRNY